MKVRSQYGDVVVIMAPADAHSFGCFLARIIPYGDAAIEEAHAIIREAHLHDGRVDNVCDPADDCPFPLPVES